MVIGVRGRAFPAVAGRTGIRLISVEGSAFSFGTRRDAARTVQLEVEAFTVLRDNDSTSDLTQVADAINRDLDGDGVMVVWKPDRGQAAILYGAGACTSGAGEAQSYLAATLAVLHRIGGGPRTYWRTPEDSLASGMLVAAFPVEAGTILVSILFARIERATRTHAVESIARILPFIHPFLAGWVISRVAATSIEGLKAALNGVGIGIVLVDRDGQVILANSAADRLIHAGDGLRRRGAALFGARFAETAKLHAAIDQAVEPRKGVSADDHQVLSLGRESGSALIVAVFPTLQTAVFGDATAAVICVVDPDLDVRSLVGQVSEMYGMSRVETDLACELAMGRSLIEAATSMRIREATARSYLKQLFLKTGTHRQVELVRLLIAGAAAMPVAGHPRRL